MVHMLMFKSSALHYRKLYSGYIMVKVELMYYKHIELAYWYNAIPTLVANMKLSRCPSM